MGLIIVKPFWRCLRAVVLAAMTMATAFSAYAQVSVTPVTWNVVGLDSNNVSVGPNMFPVGVRVCNTGSTLLSGLKARYVWDSTSAYITRTSAEYLDIPNLVAGTCQDIFHEVTVTRNAAAYTQAARYHIDVINEVNAVLASTPTPREIYVERLVSQNRNAIDNILVNNTSVSGSTNVNEGQTYEIKLVGHTATQGYEQFEQFLNFRSDLFLVKSVKSTYTAAAGTDLLAGSKIYADGCQWVNDPTDVVTPSYRECQGGGKYGGSTTLTYVVEIKAGAAALASTGVSINALLYDFSGSSYHYNADQSAAITFNFTNTPPPAEVDLAMAKSAVLSSPGNGEFTLTVTNTGSIDATNVVVTDNVPDGYNIKNSQPAASTGTLTWTRTNPESLVWTIASLSAGSSISYTFHVQTVNNQTNYVNQVCVAADETDPNTTNNCATAAVPVVQSDLALVKTASFTSPLKIGDSITFNVGVLNLGPSVGTGVVVSDTLPAGYSFTSASCASGWTPSNTGTTYSCTATSNVAVSTVPVTILTIVAQVLAPVDPTNTTGYQNTVSVTSASSDPVAFNNQASAVAPPTFLTIAKVADAVSYTSASPNGTYTLTVTKSGTSADLGVVSVQDVLPLGVSATSITGTGWTCSLVTLICTRPDDLTSGIPPSRTYPNIVIGMTFSGPSNPDVVNHANVISEKDGIVTSYDETTRSVSWTNSAVYYTVDATALPAGGGSAACSPSSVLSGANSVCTATPNTGYYFTGWTGACAAAGTNSTCNLNNVTANQSSVATFALLTYTVVATAGTGGLASCEPSSVLSGANSVCTATPNTGYYFTGWTGSCAAADTNLTCNLNNVTANQSSVASFALLTYTVVATAGTGGSVSCTPSPVSAGGAATCTATAGAGSTFTGWTGACAGQSGPVCNLTGIAANMASTASFTATVITGSVQAIPTLSGQLMIVMVLLMVLAACAAIKAHARNCR